MEKRQTSVFKAVLDGSERSVFELKFSISVIPAAWLGTLLTRANCLIQQSDEAGDPSIELCGRGRQEISLGEFFLD